MHRKLARRRLDRAIPCRGGLVSPAALQREMARSSRAMTRVRRNGRARQELCREAVDLPRPPITETKPWVAESSRIRIRISQTETPALIQTEATALIPSWSTKADHPRLAVLVERNPWMVGLRLPRRNGALSSTHMRVEPAMTPGNGQAPLGTWRIYVPEDPKTWSIYVSRGPKSRLIEGLKSPSGRAAVPRQTPAA
jgi:hypothetical protein